MRTHFGSALFLAVAAVLSPAQNPSSSTPATASQNTTPATQDSSSASAAPAMAKGSVIPAELSKSLDAKKAKPGDRVEAKTTLDLLAHGKIVLPRNSKIVGHVTEAKPRTKDSPDSVIGIAFDQILLKDGRQISAQFAVQAMGRPLQAAMPGYEATPENSAANSGPVGRMGNGSPMGGSGMGGPTLGNPSGTMPQRPYPGSDPTGGGEGRGNNPSGGTTLAALGPTSQGAVGMKGLSLTASGPAALVRSSTQNVHLEGGTQLLLRSQ